VFIVYCTICGKEEAFPFTCKRCGMILCAKHRLPENHSCPGFNAAPKTWSILGEPIKKSKPFRERKYEPLKDKVNQGIMKPRKQQGRFRGLVYFTKTEKLDLLKSWGTLTLVYIFSMYQFSIFLVPVTFLVVYPWVMLTAFLTFIVHELAHKISAQFYGLEAHYRVNLIMLLISLAASLTGYLFFIGGAVFIQGAFSRKQNGIIAMAGPLSNIATAAVVLLIKAVTARMPYSYFLDSLFMMNAWLAIYNLLPFYIFDGKKVFHWNPGIWVGLIASAITILVVNYRFIDPLYFY
jgi:Zn-dependent protease